MFLSQRDPQLRVFDQRHVVLQHLSITQHPRFKLLLIVQVFQAPPLYLCGGGVFLQDVDDSLEAERRLLPGEAQPVPAVKQSVDVRPRLQLRPSCQRRRKELFL